MTRLHRLTLVVRLLVAGILLQTLYFKFTGAPESVAIFSRMGMEPWGRYATGIAELFAAVLLLLRPTQFVALGAFSATGVITGAIFSHLFVLGIEVEGDGGLLFALALLVFLGAGFVLAVHREGLWWWREQARSWIASRRRERA
ncbi:MAG: DoxX family protein [Planctomycetes bacterium]|nr:DoxX family protein [Planctomycetota bacterium]